jgi:hypothetical protein
MEKWKSFDINQQVKYDGPGVYKIRLFREERPVPIRRFGGIDEEGILMIGVSDNIERRRKEFVRASNKGYQHSEGMQWFLVKHVSHLRESIYSLRFEFIETDTKERAEEMEGEEAWRYFEKYWETPPLNSVLPKRGERLNELRRKAEYLQS